VGSFSYKLYLLSFHISYICLYFTVREHFFLCSGPDVTPLTLQDVRGRARNMVREQEAEGEKK